MEFQVINRNRNAVIPEGMFKLCGMEDAKLISMVQLNGGILLMPESVSTYQLLMLIDALNEQACEFLEAVAAECGPAEAEHRDMTLDEVLREFTVAVPDWAREKAGITVDTKLDCEASEDAGVIAVYPASYRHDLTDVPRSILQCLLASGHSLYALNDTVTFDGMFRVHGIRLAESKQGLNIFMPQRTFEKNGKTQYADVFHPITAGARNALKEAVIDAYRKATK